MDPVPLTGIFVPVLNTVRVFAIDIAKANIHNEISTAVLPIQ